eukprot:7390469-Pyramimonas_sp.AAC.1
MERSWSAAEVAAPWHMSMTVLQSVKMLTCCESLAAMIHMSVCITATVSSVVLVYALLLISMLCLLLTIP